MDSKLDFWLRNNHARFRDNSGRVGISKLESAIEKEFGLGSFDQAELFRWLDGNNIVTTQTTLLRRKYGIVRKVGRGRPRKKLANSLPAVLTQEIVVKKIEAYEINGRIFVPLENKSEALK